MLTNPVLLSIILMCVLCLLRFNVLLSILVSAIFAGFLSGDNIAHIMEILIDGMKGNLETALSYILLGALAAAIGATNLTAILVNFVARVISHQSFLFCLTIAFIACFSQNLIPVHIAFIPILIPPLLGLMNKLKIDRRGVACALTFGLQAPYVSIPVGFGLMFHELLRDELAKQGLKVSLSEIASVMWIGGVIMLFGLICALIFYKKPRIYGEISCENSANLSANSLKMGRKEWGVLIGAVVAFIVQIELKSLPIGALAGLLVMIITGGIEYRKMDAIMEKGLSMMAFIAFVMLVASGFAEVMKNTNGIDELVKFASLISGGAFGGALIMLIIGLLVTMGIGTSFGTIPIIAAIYVPFCASLGFGVSATILLVGIAAALGDAGSPASDSTMGPTSGLNSDGEHNHIYDTCVPTFIFFNIPLVVFGAIVAVML